MIMCSCIIISLTLLFLSTTVETQFNLYYTDFANNSHLYYDCLYYKTINSIEKYESIKISFQIPYQIIEYCTRPIESANTDGKRTMNGSILSVHTFEELRKQRITVQDLFSWSAPIDLLERYEYYIETSNSSLISQTFYNCTPPWFGVFCEYIFDIDGTFDKTVEQHFERKDKSTCDLFVALPKITNLTCYVHLECNRGPAPICLDWHEICDGQIHCIGSGIDEMNCFELEVNECENDEYRCHNGMCIPEHFLNDMSFYPDCLDVTDERFYYVQRSNGRTFPTCVYDPTFRCEDVNYPIRNLGPTRGNEPYFDFASSVSREEFLGLLYQADNRRHMTFGHSILLDAEHTNLTYDCWLLMSCLTFGRFIAMCDTLCGRNSCYLRIESKCNTSTYVIFPTIPVFQSHVLLGYWTNRTVHYHFSSLEIQANFLCYDVQQCPFFSNSFSIDHYTCIDHRKIGLKGGNDMKRFFDQCLTVEKSGNETDCFHPSLFHCPGTPKCISKHRLIDGVNDCYKSADEIFVDSCKLNNKHRFQCSSEKKCISRILVGNFAKNCRDGEDEFLPLHNKLFFENLCNGYTHYLPILVEEQNETDETNCEQWPCNNQYTRCDGTWTCDNGADELNCNPLSKCHPDHHECVSPITFEVICLPLNRSGDGKMDCLGGTDERVYCRDLYANFFFSHYRCWNETTCVFNGCHGMDGCLFENNVGLKNICNANDHIKAIFENFYRDKYLKDTDMDTIQDHFPRYKYFTLRSSVYLTHARSIEMKKISDKSKPSTLLDKKTDFRRAWICNRGILVFVGTDKIEHCLCPPSYYGDRCQFQSQRISLTVQFSKECILNCHGVYTIVLILVDQNHRISSYEQLTYIPTNDCTLKYNLYFLYESRPKDMTQNYTIDIHVYNKSDLSYYTSWTLPVKFLVLPVNRMAASLLIPPHPSSVFDNCTLVCGNHGHCTIFINSGKEFCRCDLGWSGRECTIENLNCDCSSDSHCLGLANNRSICLCPLYKVGPRCFLRSICQEGTCQHGGYCGSKDDQWPLNTFKCICAPGHRGSTCDIQDTQIDFSFSNIEIPQSLLLYFITVQEEDDPLITTIAKKIRFDQKTVRLFTSLLFNLIFTRSSNEYYLLFQQINATYSPHLSIEIRSSQRCLSINNLFDNRTMSFPLLRRAKYYHVACREHPQLNCFYDEEAFMCLCNEDRFANCFYLNSSKKFTCQGRNPCENDGECFDDLPSCPTSKICVCHECYYGGQCQFTTKGFSLSLDIILSYQIHRHLSIPHQSAAVKVSITIITMLLFISLTSGTLSLLIFSSKSVREVGCGLYLFTLSLLSIICVLILNVKVWLLLAIETFWTRNRTLLWINCISSEFLLRFLPMTVDWLSACVAIERTFVVIKGVHFNQKKSKRIARWITISVILFNIVSIIQDPIHRQLIDDNEEERTWCITRYSFLLEIYNSVIYLIHFLLPFCINFISAVIIIISAARIHANARKKQSYAQYLQEQLREYKHFILSPFLLVILGIPRVFISFSSGCMKSPRDPWLFLFGYFVSFLPPLLAPFVFILPSKTYIKELQLLLQHMRENIHRALHLH